MVLGASVCLGTTVAWAQAVSPLETVDADGQGLKLRPSGQLVDRLPPDAALEGAPAPQQPVAPAPDAAPEPAATPAAPAN